MLGDGLLEVFLVHNIISIYVSICPIVCLPSTFFNFFLLLKDAVSAGLQLAESMHIISKSLLSTPIKHLTHTASTSMSGIVA